MKLVEFLIPGLSESWSNSEVCSATNKIENKDTERRNLQYKTMSIIETEMNKE